MNEGTLASIKISYLSDSMNVDRGWEDIVVAVDAVSEGRRVYEDLFSCSSGRENVALWVQLLIRM